MEFEADLLVAHPGKHYVPNLVAGCIKAGVNVRYVTPYYSSGIGRAVSHLPGGLGRKSRGYFHPGIPSSVVVSPIRWQLRKLYALYRGELAYEKEFDSYVANKIETGAYRFNTLLTLQDYMPRSTLVAKRRGLRIWSDQISFFSQEALKRLRQHESETAKTTIAFPDIQLNSEILSMADIVTLPASYGLKTLHSQIAKNAIVEVIPYGANIVFSSDAGAKPENEIVVLARAPSIAKGGHILLNALIEAAPQIVKTCFPQILKVIILGELEPYVRGLLDGHEWPDSMRIEHGSVPHADVPALLRKSSLFVMPSLFEGMSLSCVEAMHAGLPLIITEYCGIDDFKDGEMGYLVTDTSDSLSRALIAAFANRHLWDKWGENTRTVARELSWDAYERRIGQLAARVIR